MFLFDKIKSKYFYKVKTKKEKVLRKKPPLLYGEKFPFCSGVFRNNFELVLKFTRLSIAMLFEL